MVVCAFQVDLDPVGKGRPRFFITRRPTHDGRINLHPVAYTPQKTRLSEARIAQEAKRAMQGINPISQPCAVEIRAFYALPKSTSQRKELELVGQPCAKKPDLDNVTKLVMDALNGIVWTDDRFVSEIHATKTHAQNGFGGLAVQVTIEDELCS